MFCVGLRGAYQCSDGAYQVGLLHNTARLYIHQSFQPCERVLNSRYARANTNT